MRERWLLYMYSLTRECVLSIECVGIALATMPPTNFGYVVRQEYFADLKVQFDEMRISFDRDLTQVGRIICTYIL